MAGLEGTKVGPYEIKVLLGAGGMGRVYRARDPRLEREVAIKVLTAALANEPGYLERFRREARAVAKLNHPNVVQVYDFGAQNDLTYLVMPLVPGGTLRDYLAHRRILPLAETISILEQVAGALQYAHERGLVHRDVKPANILMGAEGRALLSDFGIVRLVEKEEAPTALTRAGAFVGSPEYAAPEMIMGEAVDHRVDVYAVGVMLFQMLTGRLPFSASTPVAILLMQTQQPPPKPRSLNPDLSPAVEAVILKALAKQPVERYQTVAELVAALRAASAAPTVEGTCVAPAVEALGNLPTISVDDLPTAPRRGRATATLPPETETELFVSTSELPSTPALLAPSPPKASPPRRGWVRPVLLLFLALALVAGGGTTLALAASLGLLKGGATNAPVVRIVSGGTPTTRPSPTPTAAPTAYYKAQFYVVMNQDLQNGDTVGNPIPVTANDYDAREGSNGDLYQNGTADMVNRVYGIAQRVSDSFGAPKFVVLVDRIDTYQDAHQYFLRQQPLIHGTATPEGVGDEALAGIVQANGKPTYQLFVHDRNIFITIATVPVNTPQDFGAYFVSIIKAILLRGHHCLYSTDANLAPLPSDPNGC